MITPHRTNVAHKMGVCQVSVSEKCKDGQIVEVWTQPNNILMCSDCIEQEAALTLKYAEAKRIVSESRKQDKQIEVIQDLFNAKTTAAEELYKAIQADGSIPNEEKDYRFNKEMELRYETIKAVIQRDEVALNEKRNEAAMWKVQLQSTAPRLHTKYQEEFKKFIIAENYTPAPKKPVKSAVTSGPSKSKSIIKAEIHDASVKYGIKENSIRMMMELRKMSADETGRIMAEGIAKSKLKD